jgi:hypothetical protein
MRKKCVRGTKSVRNPLIVAIAIVSAMALNPSAHFIDPSTLPRLSADGIQYLGAFRVPKQLSNGDSFSYGGGGAAFRASTNSLFMSSRLGRVAEVTIPAPVMAANVAQLPMASFLQPFADPMEGALSQVASGGVSLSGLMIYGDRLYGTASIYYDASNSQKLSHFSHSLQLNQPSFSGWTRVWEERKTGFVAGYMSLVPAEWQSRLGGPAVTGQCCLPIITRTSFGPSALSFDPAQIGGATTPASPLVYYNSEHPTLGIFSGANATWGGTAGMGGVALIGGTRTALFVGRNGLGEYCYGNGTATQALHGTPSPDGSKWCYDPTSADKGQHAYPYRFQIWAYDLNDLAAVKAGQKQPWEIIPYGVWPLDLPYYESRFTIGGVTYDGERQLLYVTQQYADKVDVASHPIVHVFQLDVAPPPPPVSLVTLTADKTAPQLPNTPITFAAVPAGGVAPFQYKWTVTGGDFDIALAAPWTTSSTFAWTPSAANTNYKVSVSVRSAWNGDEVGEATASLPFAIPAPVSAVNVTASHAAPQLTNTPITFTASPTGGIAPYSYAWAVSTDGITWTPAATWNTSDTFAWTPTTANANYRVAVWARSAGNGDEAGEATGSMPFAIRAVVSAVSVTASHPAPQLTNTPITFTASPIGGTAPYSYKWATSTDGVTWTPASWSTSNTFAWTPTTANATYRVAVWARSAWNNDEAGEATGSMPFAIRAVVSAVSVAASHPAPQLTNTPITFTASPAGGTAPYSYKWATSTDGVTWTPASWSTSNTFAWTPTTANANYRVAVWARSAGNNDDAGEATGSMPFAIRAVVSAVSVTASHTAPQLTNTPITFTASPTGGTAPYSYKWATSTDGVTWTPASWSTSNTFAWTPTTANANYRVAVWARSAGNSADAGEATGSMPFAITLPPPPPPPPAPTVTTTTKVTAVTLAAGQGSSVLTGTATTWTATATGGVGPLQYKWYVHNGANWIVYKHWSTDATFTYIPGLAATNKVSVGVRSAGNTKDESEASIAGTSFLVSGPSMVTPLPPPQTSAKVLAVFVAADKAAPQPSGATVTWSATAVGGTAPALYKWFVYNGSAWVAQSGWTSSNTFAWTPPSPNTRYKIAVWAKNPTSAADAAEASTMFEYLITP